MLVDAESLDSIEFSFEKAVKQDIGSKIRQQQLYNAQLCKFYQKGTCMKGDSCPYRHSKGEKSVVCKHWLRGLCKKSDLCEFLHEYNLSKMPVCHFYSNFGKCSNAECYFLHVKPEDRAKDCPWYTTGFCRRGPQCRNRHVRKQPCPKYLAGFCIEGPNCPLGHPKFEMGAENPSSGFLSITCNKCGNVGHKANQCQIFSTPTTKNKIGSRDLSAVTCFKCGLKGHYANSCSNTRAPPPVGGYRLPPYQAQQQNRQR